jgi:hypothetical protein
LGVSLGEQVRSNWCIDFLRKITQDAKHDAKIVVLNDEEIEAMRVSSRLGRKTMDTVAAAIEPGITTDELDRIVHEVRSDFWRQFEKFTPLFRRLLTTIATRRRWVTVAFQSPCARQ